MTSYVLLMEYTNQGIRDVKETTKRATAVTKEASAKFGVKITDVLWTFGQYDLVVLAEAPNDKAMAACSLSLGMRGDVRIQTLPAFRAPEVDAVLAKL